MSDHPLEPLRNRTIGAYLDSLASSRPAPGGGSVAGLMGALAAALGQMVVSLSNEEEALAALGTTFEALESLRDTLLDGSEADEQAYAGYIEATKLPKQTADEKSTRRQAMQSALRRSAEAPMRIAESSLEVLGRLDPVARHGNRHALSDVEIAIELAHSAVGAGLVNVRANVPMIKDSELSTALCFKADALERRASEQAQACLRVLKERRNA